MALSVSFNRRWTSARSPSKRLGSSGSGSLWALICAALLPDQMCFSKSNQIPPESGCRYTVPHSSRHLRNSPSV
jgi:hypothetical protein